MTLAAVPYRLTDDATAKLERLVDEIEANPGEFVDVGEVHQAQELIDMQAVMRSLPPSLPEAEFLDVLRLALLTECATDTYAGYIGGNARAFGDLWLARFNERVWAPDEHLHHTPYKAILLRAGFSEEELQRQMREARERTFVVRSGDTPVQITTYALIQEYLTDHWHGLIANMLKAGAPEAAMLVNKVKRRETFHTVWYRDMTMLQLEGDAQCFPLIAYAATNFTMPGNSLVPELQPKALGWMPGLGADYERMARDMVRLFYEVVGNSKRLGAFLLEIAAQKDYNHTPLSPKMANALSKRLGGVGQRLVGEAMLERVGLAHLLRKEHGDRAEARDPYHRVRAALRSWLAQRIDVKFEPAAA